MSSVVVGALLSRPAMERKVAAALWRGDVVHAFSAWSDLVAFAQMKSPDVVFLDPMVEPSADWATRLPSLEGIFPRRIILYTVLTPALAEILLSLGKRGIREIVFHRLDDHTDRMAEALMSVGIDRT